MATDAETIPQTKQGWWMFLAFFVVGNLVTVGAPVAFFRRFGFVSPLFVLGADLLFWLFLAGEGDAPGYFFAVALWPVYLTIYVLAVVIEGFVRTGGFPSTSSAL
ncbi:hypothetical protein [Halococcus salsus]|uniref:hypothetical protein n=1 Tax=Halococcus salsus TaxID=2162894 RepID=UPI00196334DC|nr:hypothetical protein [Halococcus salsus]